MVAASVLAEVIDPVGVITAAGALVGVIVTLVKARPERDGQVAVAYGQLVDDLRAQLDAERQRNDALEQRVRQLEKPGAGRRSGRS